MGAESVEVFSFVSENRKVKTPALSHKTRQGPGTRLVLLMKKLWR
jgi:hypothetical protein